MLLRADASPEAGAGHLLRMVALGAALRSSSDVTLATCTTHPGLLEHAAHHGLAVVHLDRPYPAPDDADGVLARARAAVAPWVVVDGYQFDGRYAERLRGAGARVAMVDDLPRLERYDVDLLLDQNPGALRQPYAGAPSRLLLGPQFTLLRPGFAAARTGARPDGRRILVSAGASDVGGVTSRILEALAPRTELQVTAVIGAANPGGAAVRAAFADVPHIRFAENSLDMPALMTGADLAIASTGIMLWELACLGVPTLVISSTPVQHAVARIAHECGAWQWLGDSAAMTSAEIGAALDALLADSARRAEMSRLGRIIVDGQGAARVARALLTEAPPDWAVRRSGPADAEAIWEIAADPGVRRLSFRSETFGFAEHDAWYRRRLESPACQLWVVAREGVVGGFVRYDRSGEDAEVSIAVAPALRGHGLGARLLSESARPAGRALGVRRIRASVLEDNDTSRRLFASVGFAAVDGPAARYGHPCLMFELAVTPEAAAS